MGIDRKYGRVTVEKVRNRPIDDDEPVVVFRAQDRTLPAVLEAYYDLCSAVGSPSDHLEAIYQAREDVISWQLAHPIQTPGSDELERTSG